MSRKPILRMTLGLLVGMLVMSTDVMRAQQSPLVRAESLVSAKKWDDARAVLYPEMQRPDYRTDAHAWYVLGFIEKERFKANGASGLDAEERLAAVNGFQRALELGGLPLREMEIAREALDFLSRTYFREAIERVEGFTLGAEADVMALMGRYESIQQSLNPAHDSREQRADLHRYLGQAHARLLETERYAGTANEQMAFEGAVSHYESSLNLAPNHYASLYNLAITLYNHGVRQLKRINHETSMFELMEIQDACVGLFEAALIPMEMAHDQRPERLETLKGLMTVHYALSQQAESDAYKRKIEEVLQKRP